MYKLNNKGFTLIELLIVIVILGILAVAVLSAINPVEQIRKATDSGKKSDAAELLNAYERYYTTFQKYPWEILGQTAPSASPANSASAAVGELATKNEVKAEFQNRKNLPNLLVTLDASNLVHVCFVPESASFKAQANKDASGGTGTTHICVPE